MFGPAAVVVLQAELAVVVGTGRLISLKSK
jgi:hypothetical protein